MTSTKRRDGVEEDAKPAAAEKAELMWGGLLAHDVAASRAWAAELAASGVLEASEAHRLDGALADIAAEGPPAFEAGPEDVHSHVEARLFALIGPLAGKLHTGRSRNDQVATDLKLWLRDAFAEARTLVLDVAEALAARAEAECATAMPGYTHLKRAVPVTFGHWALAYAEMLLRDADRLRAAAARADECPLGSGALAGTPLPIDRARLASALGFARPTANSLDAVSDRDGAVDYLHAAALLLSHVSRLAEDLILFSSDEVGFAELPDALATGSSRMPQKKNPDLLELLRGHAGRVSGHLAGLLAILKGLPLAYDKDLQLDKEPLFETRGTLAAGLFALRALVVGLTLDRERMRAAASDERLLATDVADAIAARGVPFRTAHEIVGKRLSQARLSGKTMAELGPGGGVTKADLAALDAGRALARRSALGGTAPAAVRDAARAAIRRVALARSGG